MCKILIFLPGHLLSTYLEKMKIEHKNFKMFQIMLTVSFSNDIAT